MKVAVSLFCLPLLRPEDRSSNSDLVLDRLSFLSLLEISIFAVIAVGQSLILPVTNLSWKVKYRVTHHIILLVPLTLNKKLPFSEHILKRNLCFHVNRTNGTTWCVTLYSRKKHAVILSMRAVRPRPCCLWLCNSAISSYPPIFGVELRGKIPDQSRLSLFSKIANFQILESLLAVFECAPQSDLSSNMQCPRSVALNNENWPIKRVDQISMHLAWKYHIPKKT